jgi:hypothetical protein
MKAPHGINVRRFFYDSTDGTITTPLPTTLASRTHSRRLRGPGRNGQAIAFVYGRESEAEARQANVHTLDEVRRIAVNIARLPEVLHRENVD